MKSPRLLYETEIIKNTSVKLERNFTVSNDIELRKTNLSFYNDVSIHVKNTS